MISESVAKTGLCDGEDGSKTLVRTFKKEGWMMFKVGDAGAIGRSRDGLGRP